MFGLLMQHYSWPLAIMLSADRVPVKSMRLIGAMALLGCPGLWADFIGRVIRSLPFLHRSVPDRCGRLSVRMRTLTGDPPSERIGPSLTFGYVQAMPR